MTYSMIDCDNISVSIRALTEVNAGKDGCENRDDGNNKNPLHIFHAICLQIGHVRILGDRFFSNARWYALSRASFHSRSHSDESERECISPAPAGSMPKIQVYQWVTDLPVQRNSGSLNISNFP